MASPVYSKLLDPVSDVISCMESILSGAAGYSTGDQRECYKRIHAYSWGLHTLVMDVITTIGIENAATRPAVLDRFNSLIRPINVNLENLVAGFDGELTEEQDHLIAFVAAAVMSIEHMMSNLWHYSLLKHSMLECSIQSFRGEVLTRKLRSILTTAKLPDKFPSALVLGDKNWLCYAFGEVAVNIWQHGSVDKVSYDMRRIADRLEYCLIDEGEGFVASDDSEAFQPFWQADQRNRGLGLGLYLAKIFIEMSGGSISVESRPGQGTMVTISLMLAA